jgi:hypothetical protein
MITINKTQITSLTRNTLNIIQAKTQRK